MVEIPDNSLTFAKWDADTYQVSYKVVGDENHNDMAEKTITVITAECDHTGGNVTCVEKATCEKRGDIYGDLKHHNHDQ